MDWKLEVVVVPVSDVDRAKSFYTDGVGFTLDVDHAAGDDFRVVQLTPPGSACSITLMKNPGAAGSVHGLHLIVSDIDLAHTALSERGTGASEIFHFEDGAQLPGPDPRTPRLRLVLLVQRPRRQQLPCAGVQEPIPGELSLSIGRRSRGTCPQTDGPAEPIHRQAVRQFATKPAPECPLVSLRVDFRTGVPR